MIKFLLPLCLLMFLTSCNLGYGPVHDYSRFVSAKLLDDRKSILFTYHRFTYRPATGWRAFPDGGIPKYEEDRSIIGLYDLGREKVTILRREDNTEWQPGSGLYTVHAVNENIALLAQGGQLRGPFKLGVKYLLLDMKRQKGTGIDLKGDLAGLGRDCGEIYLVDGEGTLVLITQPLSAAEDSRHRKNRDESEIWIRTAGNGYLKVAASALYETVRNGEIIYWIRETRQFQAFSIVTHLNRPAPEFRYGEYRDVTEGASLSADRKGLEYGMKVNDAWQYRPLAIPPHFLK